uniref:Fungal lipase-like domain-containing protein n=1 Tax=Aegilops tauschii TaxID=37682 RepID=M8C2M5_AEGTA
MGEQSKMQYYAGGTSFNSPHAGPHGRDCFCISGPKHIVQSVDWSNEEHRRCIAACLVKATYIMEEDRPKCRVYDMGLAPLWWQSFHFELRDLLKCGTENADEFIFGAIFEYCPPVGCQRHPSAPNYVFALRGTMPRHPKSVHDLYNDIKVFLSDLPCCRRTQKARQAVTNMLIRKGTERCVLWLAGHSLGASLALEVGRDMAEQHQAYLPTFLFNPPNVSPMPALNLLNASEVAKKDVFTGSYLVKAALGATVMRSYCTRMEKVFQRLSPWVPGLYVNERDIIGQGFTDSFEQRQKVEERIAGVGRAAMKLSYRDMLSSLIGSSKEQPHLLPSARLWKNSNTTFGTHGLKQWWRPDSELKLSCRKFTYPGA